MNVHTAIFLLLILEFISNIIGFEKNYNTGNNIEFVADNANNEINKRAKRQMKKDKKSLWASPINFAIESKVDQPMLRHLLREIQIHTCIQFNEDMRRIKKSGIFFRYSEECFSKIGRKSYDKWQEVFLGGRNCNTKHLYLQQILRTLGMYFEQNRFDRNLYVRVLYENVKPEYSHIFLTLKPSDLTTHKLPYDYGSIMHADVYAYSKNNNYTIVPLDYLYTKTLGSSTSPSFIDYKLLNLHYCKRSCKYFLNCFHGSYQNSNDCSNCRCVKGYVGKRCENFQPPLHSSCGKSIYKVEDYAKTLKISGAKKCIYHLIARNGRKIVFFIEASMQLNPSKKPYICNSLNSLEVKYYKDKTVTGARICGTSSITATKSENNHIILYYKSSIQSNYVTITFRTKSYGTFNRETFNRGTSFINKMKHRRYSLIE
uniref:Metalloendopeptidase n=1 Tax=Strongyloides papillosus TaxID=174720 RepID=A0A0N5C3C4_STREA